MTIDEDLKELEKDIRCTLVHINNDTVELSDLYIPESLRHRGVGKNIVLSAIAQAKELGAKHIQIHIPAAYMGWWSELFFVVVGMEVHMCLDLSSPGAKKILGEADEAM